jgi:alkyl sulfatase BDS1-like metallo-beta-lactamase superfamily hydrolase
MTDSCGDFEQARRGLIARFDPPRVEKRGRRIVWELASHDFLANNPPPTGNANLWRQSQLGCIAGRYVEFIGGAEAVLE